jgi:hypothetical protein
MKHFLLIVILLTTQMSGPLSHWLEDFPFFGPIPAHAQFKASTVTTQDAYSDIRRQAVASRAFLVANRALMVAAQVNSTVPLAVITHLSTVVPRLDLLAGTPGLPQYAKDQQGDQNYNVVVQYTTMRDLMVSVMTTLIAMFPTNGGTPAYLIYETLSVAGVRTARVFTAAQVAPAVVAIDALIAAIQ